VLKAADGPITHAYFPEGGMASLVALLPDGARVEVGVVGREGLTAIPLVLGTDQSPFEVMVQLPAEAALRMPADRLTEAMEARPSLRMALTRFVQAFSVQTAYSVVANAHYSVEERLARWLLMCHDRADGDEMALTHEFMSIMLASRRSSVTVALHVLEGLGSVKATRGLVKMVNRARLEELSGESYGVPEAEYRRLVGPFGKSAPPPSS
jgi:CRP-like cAMP-binding protein